MASFVPVAILHQIEFAIRIKCLAAEDGQQIEVRNAVRDTELSLQRVDLARRARALAQQKAEIEREKLSLGVSTNFQLVTFENDLVLAENAELDAVVEYLNTVTELDRTLGTTLDRWGIDMESVEDRTAVVRFGAAEGAR